MQQLRFLQNQSQLWTTTANIGNIANPYSAAKKYEKSIISVMSHKADSVVSRASFSSSWCYSGKWVSDGPKNTTGTLHLTIKQEQPIGSFKKIVGTYLYQQVSLSIWCLMKAAMGREGTGAGTVLWRTYLGYRKPGYSKPMWK